MIPASTLRATPNTRPNRRLTPHTTKPYMAIPGWDPAGLKILSDKQPMGASRAGREGKADRCTSDNSIWSSDNKKGEAA
jgi:hypothetical protein